MLPFGEPKLAKVTVHKRIALLTLCINRKWTNTQSLILVVKPYKVYRGLLCVSIKTYLSYREDHNTEIGLQQIRNLSTKHRVTFIQDVYFNEQFNRAVAPETLLFSACLSVCSLFDCFRFSTNAGKHWSSSWSNVLAGYW